MADRPRAPIALPARAQLAARVVQVLHRGRTWNPDVFLVEHAGQRMVVKDFAARPAWVRASAGRWVTAREARAWRRLDGHPAVPRFFGRIDALAFAVEYRPGVHMSRRSAAKIPPEFGDRLEAALDEMHRRGVVHLDLSHRSNVLADAAGEPVLIDFGSAVALAPGGWPARLLLPWLARLDRRALAKWRRKLAGYRAAEGSAELAAGGAGVSGSARGASRPT